MRTLAAIAGVLLVIGCQPGTTKLTEAEIAEIETQILSIMENRFDALRDLDVESYARTAHPDLLTWPAGGQLMNRSQYKDALLAWAEGKESWSGGWIESKVRVLSPDFAVFSGTYTDTIRFSDGRHLHWPEAVAVFLFERTPEGWKFIMGGESAAPPEPVE
jgi:ketosteroid isomerase-like protein